MSEKLEPAKQQKWYQIAHMEAVGGRVKAGVDRYWALPESIAEELTHAAEAVNLWTDADRITPHVVTIGDRAYWIQSAAVTR